jgi:hypothetical protein
MRLFECAAATAVLIMGVACEPKATEAPASVSPAATPSASASPNAASGAPTPSSAPPTSTNAPAGSDGPVVEVKGELLLVDGNASGNTRAAKLDELSRHLVSTRELWTKLHPNETFPGRCVIKSEKGTSPDVVARITQTARDAGYPNCAAR